MVTPDRYNGFTFDGVDSKQYGVFITDVNVFGAPVRDVEPVSIPGRNGDLLIDHGRYENIDVVYSAVIHDLENFTSIMANFRAALASKIGYKRLSDDINIGEYRLATFKDGLDVSTLNKKTGQFDITFNCKPQRYLLEGETPRLLVQNMVPSSTKTETGSIVSIESDGGDAVTSLVAQIEPVQAGSGDPSPTNVRPITGWTAAAVNVAWKNLLRIADRTQTQYGVFFESNNGIVSASGTATLATNFYCEIVAPATGNYYFGGAPSGYGGKVDIFVWDNAANARAKKWDGTTKSVSDFGETMNNEVRLEKDKHYYVTCRVYKDTTIDDVFRPMLRLASETDDTYEPYTGNTYQVSFGDAGTVYGGTVDVVTGVLTVTHVVADIGTGADTVKIITSGSVSIFDLYFSLMKPSATAANNIMCTCYKPVNKAAVALDNYECARATGSQHIYVRDTRYTTVEAFKSALTGQKVVFELATPQTYNLTAQEVELLTGDNNVWADTGDITLTYGADPYKVVNPSLFASKPLLRVTGRGTLSVGDVTMTITGTASQVLYIDCDIMEVYSITGGQMQPQNSLVTISGNEYPTLQPGATQITLGSGITQVVITPRWWRI